MPARLHHRLARSCAICAALLGTLSLSAAAGPPLPGYYQESGLSSNRAQVNYNITEYIDPFSGVLQLHQIDDTIPGNGQFNLTIQRSYNSPSTAYGTVSDTQSYNRTPDLGMGWNLLIGGRAFNVSDTGGACAGGNQLIVETPDGGKQGLLRQSDGTFLSAARWKGQCVVGGVRIYAPNGTRYDMLQMIVESIPGVVQLAPFYYPTRIEDRNGNYATLTYVASGSIVLLDNVSTSDGRTVSFGYTLTGSRQLLTSVNAMGRLWTYSYYPTPILPDSLGGNGTYALSRVDPPNGGFWEYDYYLCTNSTANKCALSEVWYPSGANIVYTYTLTNFNDGSGDARVVATKGVGGTVIPVGEGDLNWTFTYTPGTPGAMDKTEVTSTLGKMTYEHVRHSTVGPGNTWQIGLLTKRTVQNAATANSVIEVETLTWDKQQIEVAPRSWTVSRDS